jgi:hypothetical protein
VAPRSLSFVQDGLHNCGTVAMLISWASARPREASSLVRSLPDGSFRVSFPGSNPVAVSARAGLGAARGRIALCAPVPLQVLERQLRALRGRPATALTNRRVHIWPVLSYDARRKRVRARNPRRSRAVWMSLEEFRDKFQVLLALEPAA